jgi:prepilin-type N-terminal cleavage/methylation domain-containing protein
MPIKRGFTLIEVLVVIAILAILVIGTLFSLTQQRLKAEDAQVKSYLSRLKIAFEEYYNDKGCFPPTEWFDDQSDCGSSNLNPYLNYIQCDKKTGLPYAYETDSTACHQWFKFYATFNLPHFDQQAISQRSPLGSKKGNYGVSSTNVNLTVYYEAPQGTLTPSPTPLPPGHNYYYCSSIGNCTSNFDLNQICAPIFIDDANCGGSLEIKCPLELVGSCIHL